MRARTHFAFSAASSAVIIRLLGDSFLQNDSGRVAFIFASAFFSLLPDIDLHTSKIGKSLLPASYLVESIFSHRGAIHSLAFAFGTYSLFYISGSIFLGAAFLTGYLSHLFLDALNHKGIPWLYPYQRRLRGPFKSGGVADASLLGASLLFLGYAAILWLL